MRLACPYQLSPTQNLLGNGMQVSARNEGVATDPYWSSVVLLALNENGSEGSTTFTDASNSPITLTGAGNVQWDTGVTPPASATSAGLFDGTGDYINAGSATPEAKLDFANSDFCIEAFVRPVNTTTQLVFGSLANATGHGRYWFNINATFTGNNKFQFGYNTTSGGSGINILKGANTTIATNSWTHVAVSRNAANVRFFEAGTQVGTTDTSIGTATIFAVDQQVRIGHTFDGASYAMNGHICSLRVTVGNARYTADFTPPTLPLPTS